jgi:uncharacterized GH25 family protein
MNKSNKTSLIFLCLCTITFASLAHEFWLLPQKFRLKINESIAIDINVGENFTGKYWGGKKDKIAKLTHYSQEGQEEILGSVAESNPNQIQVAFKTAGNHLIAFNNENKFIELEAPKFNEYLKEEGLDNALAFRKEQSLLDTKGRELYRRCVKTLLQVSDKQDDSYKINTGMRLELIPTANPYMKNTPKQLTFDVLFDNQIQANALVLVWQKVNGKVNMKKYRSNADGKVNFPFEAKGKWMISTVKMIPHTDPKEADWQSFWGSYTFGF